MLSFFSFSRIMLRYALQIPNPSPCCVPYSALRLCFPSTSSLHSHSHSQPQSRDEAVDSFTRMLSMRRPPSIIQFTKILGSLAKTNHFPTAISLFQQLIYFEYLNQLLLRNGLDHSCFLCFRKDFQEWFSA
ncbi:hypothetical protein HN873_052551 [Arachis hypogaea]